MNTTIILDCDPGIDDALAIAFAAGYPEIELAGITTVAGNLGLGQTTTDARAAAAPPRAGGGARARGVRPGRSGAAGAGAKGGGRARHGLRHRPARRRA